MGNDIEIRVRVANQTGTGLTSVNSSLSTLRDRARAASTALTGLRAAARDIDVAVRLDDRTVAGFAAIQRSMTAIRAASRADISVGLDDRTAAGFTTISGRIRDLRAQSPIRLDVTFDNQSGQINSTSRAIRGLNTAAQRASTSLAALTAAGVTASVSLQRLAAAAEDATRELNQLRAAGSRAATAVGRLGQRAEDTEDRLAHLTGTAANLTLQIGDLGSASRDTGDDLRDLRGNLGTLTVSANNAANAFGGSGSTGLRGKLIGTAVALGSALLPTIGALSPMLFGMTAVVGGGALALDDLKKKAKELKPAFEDWKKTAEKTVAPHTEKAVKSLSGAMKDLTPVIKIGADTFGRITERAARFADSPAFQSALLTNVKMGSAWFKDFAGSIGSFTQAFLEFGAKSQPALDAWDSLLGGFLDTGLPGMFDGLEQGIGGSSEMLGGLASLINDSLLPSLGKIAGSFGETFGPLLGEAFRGAGLAVEGFASVFEGAMEGLEPAAHVAADVFRTFNEVGRIGFEVASDLASVLGGALVESLLAVSGVDVSTMGEGFRGLSNWAKENETAIRGAFVAVGQTIIDMVNTGIQWLPILSNGFTLMAQTAIESADLVVSGLAMAFGNIPGIGDALKESNRKFDEWAAGASETLGAVNGKIGEFATTANEKLSRAKLKLDVKAAEDNLASIKEKLNDKDLTRERKAKLSADKREAEAALRAARGELNAFDKRRSEATIAANPRPFFGEAQRVRGTKFSKKNVPVGANAAMFNAAVRALTGRVLGTSYINVQQRFVGSAADNRAASRFSANGNIFRSFADGGVEDHSAQIAPAGAWRVWAEPETGGEAYIPLSPTKRPRSRQIAEETVGILGGAVKWYAKGGVTKAEKAARKDAWGDLTISHFGQMAGYRRSEFGSAFANPDSVSSLVNALNQWRGIIMKATHGGQERSLLKALDSTGKKLLSWEKQLGKVSASLEKAKDKLDSLKQAAASLSDSVKSGVLNASNITRGASGDGPVTVASIMGGLTASRDKATAFAQALKDLKGKGLSSSLLQQVAEAGVEGGGLETAGALLQASSSEIGSLNSLQSQITGAAGSAGKTTADSVFGAAIKAQELQVKKLTNSQEKLARSMDKLAKAMEKQIESAFKKKASGGIIGAASGGLRSGWTMVGEHEPELVRLPFGSRVYSGPDTRRMQQQAWASMLNTPRTGGTRYAPTPAATSDAQPIVLQVSIAGREFGELWVDTGRRVVKARGSIEAVLQPPRGR
ncbi:hypothetical protein [Streptomyces sp. XY006]|uniref:hypothetical protein n=1 Tax=Streptomyces sp. XY006 TaxID=2021410 RepID=UPI000B8C3FB9|nr:hypothetical protein [Streptomyces sp. XY006]OXS35378.1 hypothetical protein CHR28_10240 [Streptomyces sp. XY006]